MVVMRVALFLHVLSDIVWIGGMFLAYMCVRPAAGEVLDPPQRLRLWAGIFSRFFPWVWACVALLLLTGFGMMGHLGVVPHHIMGMAAVGLVMTAIFVYIVFVPFGQLKTAVAAQDWKSGGAALNRIRMLVGANLALGVINVAIAMLGPAGL
jgi:uncharacterized membrane protein